MFRIRLGTLRQFVREVATLGDHTMANAGSECPPGKTWNSYERRCVPRATGEEASKDADAKTKLAHDHDTHAVAADAHLAAATAHSNASAQAREEGDADARAKHDRESARHHDAYWRHKQQAERLA